MTSSSLQNSFPSAISRSLAELVESGDVDEAVARVVAEVLSYSSPEDLWNPDVLRKVLLQVLPVAVRLEAARSDELLDAVTAFLVELEQSGEARIAPSAQALGAITDALRPKVREAMLRCSHSRCGAEPSVDDDALVAAIWRSKDLHRDDHRVDDWGDVVSHRVRLAPAPGREAVAEAAGDAPVVERARRMLAQIDAGNGVGLMVADLRCARWLLEAGWTIPGDPGEGRGPLYRRGPASSVADDDPVSAVVSLLAVYPEFLRTWSDDDAEIKRRSVQAFTGLCRLLAGSRRSLDFGSTMWSSWQEYDDDVWAGECASVNWNHRMGVTLWLSDLKDLGVVELRDPFRTDALDPLEAQWAKSLGLPREDFAKLPRQPGPGVSLGLTDLGRHVLQALGYSRPLPVAADVLRGSEWSGVLRIVAPMCDGDAADILGLWAGDDAQRWRHLVSECLSEPRYADVLQIAMIEAGDAARPAVGYLLSTGASAELVRMWAIETNQLVMP